MRPSFQARVLAVFDHACDLVTSTGDIVALVTRSVGDGPLNILVDGEPGIFTSLALHPQAAVTWRAAKLQLGSGWLDLEKATLWEPRPAWEVLSSQQNIILRRLPVLGAIALEHAPVASWLPLALPRTSARQAGFLPDRAVLYGAQQALQAGWDGDAAQLQAGAARLAGLGTGLTPAGDDFLIGVMLWAWVAHPAPAAFCGVIAQAAALRTTTLSAACLRSAARGEGSAAWHRLLAALGSGLDDELTAATRQVLAHGATSGADALAGFLWAGQNLVPRTQG